MTKIHIEDYSEKAFALMGDTRPHKERIKELGGKWNSNLSIGAGWIFSVKSRDKVEEWLRSLEGDIQQIKTVEDNYDDIRGGSSLSYRTKFDNIVLDFKKFILETNSKDDIKTYITTKQSNFVIEDEIDFGKDNLHKFLSIKINTLDYDTFCKINNTNFIDYVFYLIENEE